MARDYSKGKIYCIKVNTEEEYLPYVGSTTKQYLSQRMDKHRNNYKRWKEGKNESFLSSFTLFDKYGIEECFIELLELFPCSCNEELRKKEREWFEKINCVNIVSPFTSKEEFLQKNIEWTKNNPEKRKEIQKKYHEEHREEICEKKKNSYQENKNIWKKDYEEKKEYLLEKYTCICGSVVANCGKPRHEKTKKHKNFITDKNKTELLDRLEGERIELLNIILELNNKDN
jgi:hypothetical protein